MTHTSPSPASRLRDLAAIALLGADRAGSESVSKIAGEAARAGAMSRAGFRSAVAVTPLPACPPERLQPVSAAAASTLDRLLSDGDPTLIEEWIAFATGAGRRVAHPSLPAILDWSVGRSQRSRLVLPIIGERGRWLASLNPHWVTVAAGSSLPADPIAAWSTASTPERLLLLGTARLERSTLATELVASTSNDDSADERRRFIEQFSVGLSIADEPFLESCLDDRSKVVREAAAALLARLPDSSYVRRMTARARDAFQVEGTRKGLLRKKSIEISIVPPRQWEASFERDALEQKPPGGIGERLWWLLQIVARTPPNSIFDDAPPETILEAIAKSEHAESLPAAFREAAARFDVVIWSIALAEHALNASKKGKSDPPPQIPAGLSTYHAGMLVKSLLSSDRVNLQTAWAYAAAIPRPWTIDLSQNILKKLTTKKAKTTPQWFEIGPAIDDVSRAVHPSAIAAFDSLLRTLFKDDLPPSILKSLDRVTLRSDMHKEFHS